MILRDMERDGRRGKGVFSSAGNIGARFRQPADRAARLAAAL